MRVALCTVTVDSVAVTSTASLALLGYSFKCKWLPLQALTHASHTMLDHGRRWLCDSGGEQDADGTRSIEVTTITDMFNYVQFAPPCITLCCCGAVL